MHGILCGCISNGNNGDTTRSLVAWLAYEANAVLGDLDAS
jgi:hypothetical protein